MNFVLNPNFFQTGTNLSLKVQSRMEDKVRNKNLKSLFTFFEKFGRELALYPRICDPHDDPRPFLVVGELLFKDNPLFSFIRYFL